MRTLLRFSMLATIICATSLPSVAEPAMPPASADAASAQSPVASVPENPLVTARIRQEFTAWQSGHIDRKTYSSAAGGTYSDALVAVIEPDLATVGTPQTIAYRTTSLLFGEFVYRYDITGTTGAVSVLYTLDSAGKTDGIVFTPLIFRGDSSTL